MKALRDIFALVGCIWHHPANRNGRLRALGRFLAWQIAKRVLRTPVLVRVLDQRYFAVWPDSPYSSLVVYNRFPDWDDIGLLRRILRPGDGFIDIGANVGFYSVIASTLNGESPLLSVDPNPANVTVLSLQKRINELERMRICPFALGAGNSTVAFDNCSRETGAVVVGVAGDGTLRIESRSLDSLLGDEYATTTRFIAKMDVEGYEMEVLRGAARVLADKKVWLWIFENNPVALGRNGGASADLLTVFRSAGYVIIRYHEDDRRWERFEAADAPGLCNLVACSDLARLDRLLASAPGPHPAGP